MSRFVLVRLAHSLLVLIFVLLVVFMITHALGDPVRIVLPPSAPQVQIDAVRERLHLNDPFPIQLRDFVLGALSGNFGDSYWQQEPAMQIVLGRLPATIYLSIVAFIIACPLGVSAGAIAALRPGSLVDRALRTLAFISVSVVDFWFALMLILVFSVMLRLVPTSGYGGLDHVLLPALTLALLSAGSLALVTRASMISELSRTYVSAARTRGVRERRVVLRHAFRNALIPVVTLSGALLSGFLGGTVVAEVVFAWPGIGALMIQAINQRDLPLIEATVFVAAVIVIGMNLIVDLLYGLLNPRLRVDAQ
jgi:peptide/nickel transport system permease protein